MKLSEMLFDNYNLIFVLSRFGIKLGFGEKTVEEVCKKYGISTSLFLMVTNVTTFDNYYPDNDEINSLNLEELINYLHASHTYYREDRIKAIEEKLNDLYLDNNDYKTIIGRFFSEYKNEVINHFDYEENIVFPYIKDLMHDKISVNYNINQFEKNHSNIEDKLDDLINILIKYIPEEDDRKREDALFTIFIFAKDLNKHSLIENKILIPWVKQIETEHGQQ
ncbi:MAG: hemerythrin domain-containing protein [Bacteroidales bacterium]|jgi:regulator of cell morphogenesis and NO signaling|nr:hemerythrin domain-containing protein [Bacteroidales bacterium]